jgi:hypothetical protein
VFTAATGRGSPGVAEHTAPDPAAAAAVERVYLEAGLLAVDSDGLRLVSDVLVDCWPRLREWLPDEAGHDPPSDRSHRANWPVAGTSAGTSAWTSARAGSGTLGAPVGRPAVRTGPARTAAGSPGAELVARWWAWRGAALAALLLLAVFAGVWTTLH